MYRDLHVDTKSRLTTYPEFIWTWFVTSAGPRLHTDRVPLHYTQFLHTERACTTKNDIIEATHKQSHFLMPLLPMQQLYGLTCGLFRMCLSCVQWLHSKGWAVQASGPLWLWTFRIPKKRRTSIAVALKINFRVISHASSYLKSYFRFFCFILLLVPEVQTTFLTLAKVTNWDVLPYRSNWTGEK